ncbi:MAG: LytTR family DNA-binding domain-containing protein [Chitinophagaceae bacterium]
MHINYIIAEDEPLAIERINNYARKLPFLHQLAAFENSMEALFYLQNNKPDLIFLDINMGELSGIQLLEAARPVAQVIITSAYDEYALKGFDLHVTDYLLKPFSFERFVQAVDRVKTNLAKSDTALERGFIFIKTANRLEKVVLADILYIEGMRDYRKIHTVSKKIMTLQTFSDLETELPRSIICRVHKSYMVAVNKIESIEKDIIKIRDVCIPVSETYKNYFFQLIGQRKK